VGWFLVIEMSWMIHSSAVARQEDSASVGKVGPQVGDSVVAPRG
jgi:hypothetical protein